MKKLKIIMGIISLIIIIILIVLNSLNKQTSTQKTNNFSQTDEKTQEKVITDDEQVEIYWNEFQDIIKDNPDKLLEKINSEYIKKKYSEESEMLKYIEQNVEKWKNAEMQSYEAFQCTDYKDYVCIDQYGNYYIFREDENNYSIILDIYTLDLEWQMQKYNDADDNKKMEYIIDKIVNMINCNDYKAMYNVMSQNFKNSNFESFEKFEEFAKQTFKQHTVYEIQNSEFINDTYTCDIILMQNREEDMIYPYVYSTITTVIKAKDINNFIFGFKVQEVEDEVY